MLGSMTADTILRMRQQLFGLGGQPPEWVRKSGTTTGITTGTGIVWFDLEAALKRVFPAHAPFRNETPRVGLTGVGFGLAANWRVLQNINNSLVAGYVSEGHRGGQIQYQEADKSATYKGLGLESFVNFEAEYAALGYDDILDTATTTLLMATMVEEEKNLLWGNTSLAGGTTATPTVVDNGGSGSALTATVQTVTCVALSPLGVLLAGGLAPVGTTASYVLTQAVVDQVTKTNADGTTDTINGGHAIKSAAGTVTPTATHTIKATVTGKPGAAGYAWFLGANGAGTNVLAAITAVPTVVLGAVLPAGGNQADTFTGNGSDRFQNTLAFDGMITQLLTASGWGVGGIFNQMSSLSPAPGGAYNLSLAGAPLTFTGNSINEIDTMLQWMWNAYRLYPDELWVSAYQAAKITNGITTSAAPTYRIELAGGQTTVRGGALVTQYVNKFALGGATVLPIRVHPYMPDSWIWANTKTLTDKYPIANVSVPYRVKARREYYSVAWPVTTRQRQYGVYVDEVLEHYVPFAMGLLADVG